MKSQLFHIYGPIAINSYGLFIALGVIALILIIRHDIRYKKLNLNDHFLNIIAVSIISGLSGGRLLFLLTEDTSAMTFAQKLMPWSGGFSVLGGIIAILIALPLYLKKLTIPILPFLDLAGIYAPLTQSISRIGCFFAGCCYGITSNVPWSVMYTDKKCFAPLYIHMHPSQLYSSILLLTIFGFMYFISRKKTFVSGQLFSLYLLLASLERFFVDFWRGDRILVTDSPIGALSHTQLIALTMGTGAIILFLYFKNRKL